MDIGEPERSGRHRLEDGAAPWLPLGGELDHAAAPPGTPTPTPHARPTERPPGTTGPLVTPGPARGGTGPTPAAPIPAQRAQFGPRPVAPKPDRAPQGETRAGETGDRELFGLGNFNIGLVPASVTPPRTWKRAAWFAVLSSAGVLVGLVVAAIKLVGAGTPTDRLGMPGYPTSAPIVTGFGTSTPSPTANPPERRERPEALVAPERTPEAPGTAVSGTSVTPTSSAPDTAPTVTTVPGAGKPVVDTTDVARRTERFYEQAVANAATALEMVTDTFEADVKALLKGHFSGVSLIEVTEISVDPARGVTVSTLHVKNKDGSTTTEKRQLGFTTNGDPLINAERLFDGV
ncbi:hypothetical protein ACQPW3_38605 [Actinosynnema sp. CA-248983]